MDDHLTITFNANISYSNKKVNCDIAVRLFEFIIQIFKFFYWCDVSITILWLFHDFISMFWFMTSNACLGLLIYFYDFFSSTIVLIAMLISYKVTTILRLSWITIWIVTISSTTFFLLIVPWTRAIIRAEITLPMDQPFTVCHLIAKGNCPHPSKHPWFNKTM